MQLVGLPDNNDLTRSAETWPAADRMCRAIAPPAAGLFQPEDPAKPFTLAPSERRVRAATHAADEWLERHFREYQKLRPTPGNFYPTQATAAADRARLSAE
jgi:hypothetical protein